MMDHLVIIMVITLIVVLGAGYPVAFTLGGVATIFGFIALGPDFFMFLPLRIWGRMTNLTLAAVPLFVFMGIILEKSGLAEDLLETMAILFGRVRGGLAISIVLVGALLGASTGIVGATVVTMGIISLPIMLKRGYTPEVATGVISASGTLGQIIPPSIILVLLGDIMGVSVGELFAGAFLPGMVLVSCYIIFILIYSFFKPHSSPAIPKEELDAISRKELAIRVLSVLLPPGVLIFAVLGSILFGIATPTEAAAVGAIGATILAIIKRKFTISVIKETVITTTRLSSMVFMILLGATAFALIFRGLGGDTMVREFLHGVGGGKWGIIAVVMIVLFILGFVLDFIEITFIVLPILAPILESVGINMLWASVLIAVNFQTSFLTPPFGFSLFYLKGVSPPEVKTTHIYKGIIPYVAVQLIGLTVIILIPSIVTWLPRMLFN